MRKSPLLRWLPPHRETVQNKSVTGKRSAAERAQGHDKSFAVGHLPQNVDAAISISEEEHIIIIVPRDFINLKFELLLRFGAVSFYIYESDYIILIAYCNGLTIWAPADIYVFTYKQAYK